MRGLDPGMFKKRMRDIVEICGINQVLGKDIRTLSHGFRQRVGLGQALVKGITQAHDGALTLTPRSAGGLRVTVHLPAA